MEQRPLPEGAFADGIRPALHPPFVADRVQEQMNPWITLQQIAEKAGVSRSTASRAIRHIPGTSLEAVRKVEAAARELGYRADAQLSELTLHLRRRKTAVDRPVIAFVHPLPKDLFLKWSINAVKGVNVYGGAASQAHKLGFTLEPFGINIDGMNGDRVSSILRSRGIQMVIVAPAQEAASKVELRWEWFTSVAIGYSTTLPPFHRAAPNQYQGMLEVVQQLFTLGYRKLGFVKVPQTDFRTLGNYHAAYLMLRSIHGENRFAPLLTSDGSDRKPFERWIKEHQIDVVIKAGQAIPALEWLEEINLRVPEDIGFADVHLLNNTSSISGIYQNAIDVGASAVDLLISLSHDNQEGLPEIPKTVLINGSWIEGETTRQVGPPSVDIWAPLNQRYLSETLAR